MACGTTTYRLSRDAKPMFTIVRPVVKKDLWVKAQKLVSKSHFKLAYKMGDSLVVPSESLLARLPGRTTAEKRTNIHIWVKEYVAMYKNPSGYYKVVGPQSWDFDTLMDYVHSFYVISQVPSTHPHCIDMCNAGLTKACICPQYMHYVACKHAIGLALYQGHTTVPTQVSIQIVGKRAASPGPKSSKRSHCLALDY